MALKTTSKTHRLNLMGKKRGMVQLFDENGHRMACTVIEVEPNVVVNVKTVDKDGYAAVQLGFDKVETKDERTLRRRLGQPQHGYFEKQGVTPRRYLSEFRLAGDEEYTVGQEIGVEAFADIKHVDVTGVSKGKGFQGVIKLYNYKGGPGAHGSHFHRAPGSLGMRSTPGRVLPGGRPPKRMGGDTVTLQNLELVQFSKEEDEHQNLLIVRGAVPGPVGSMVLIRSAVKEGKKAK